MLQSIIIENSKWINLLIHLVLLQKLWKISTLLSMQWFHMLLMNGHYRQNQIEIIGQNGGQK